MTDQPSASSDPPARLPGSPGGVVGTWLGKLLEKAAMVGAGGGQLPRHLQIQMRQPQRLRPALRAGPDRFDAAERVIQIDRVVLWEFARFLRRFTASHFFQADGVMDRLRMHIGGHDECSAILRERDAMHRQLPPRRGKLGYGTTLWIASENSKT